MFRATIRVILAFAVLLAVVCAASPTFAQDAAAAEQRVTLQFKGGSVHEYLTLVKEAMGDANVLVDLKTKDFALDPIDLQNANPESAIMLVDNLQKIDNGMMRMIDVVKVTGTTVDPRLGPAVRIPGAGFPVYRVVVQEALSKTESRVWSLHQLTQRGLDADAILAAIEAALSLHTEFDQPQMKYHDGTSLLIARANPTQIQAIGEVIEQLIASRIGDENARSSRLEIERFSQRLHESEDGRAHAVGQLLQAERRIAALETQLMELERLRKESSRNLEVTENAVRALQEELQRVKSDRGGGDGQ